MPTVADFLTENNGAIDSEGQYRPVYRRLRVNEYLAVYGERLKLPFQNILSFDLRAFYNNFSLRQKESTPEQIFKGAFYWPLRYYLGGSYMLSGYPYFTAEGSKLIYTRIGYSFPILNRIRSRLLNFNFSKLRGELFAEAGAVSDFRSARDIRFDSKSILSDVGGKLRLQFFSFYRFEMEAYFQAVRPLNRDRVNSDGLKIDKWRYYFGFGL